MFKSVVCHSRLAAQVFRSHAVAFTLNLTPTSLQYSSVVGNPSPLCSKATLSHSAVSRPLAQFARFEKQSTYSSSASSQPKGKLTREQLQSYAASGDIDTVCLVAPDQFGRLVGKRLDVDYFLASSESHFCKYLMTVDLDMTPQHGFSYADWHSGYGDFHVIAGEKQQEVL